jgi:hypothetical protein
VDVAMAGAPVAAARVVADAPVADAPVVAVSVVAVPVVAVSAAPAVAADVASVVVAGRPSAGKRVAVASDDDQSAPVASGDAVDRSLPGHRLDTAQATPSPSTARSSSAPAGLGMMGADRVAKVREQVATRPMQRLSIELDDARVAIRVRGDKVSVDVTSDPKGALGEGWARQVERTIDRAVKAQDPDARGTSSDRQPGSNGRRQPHQQRPAREFELDSVHFPLTPEEES